MKASDRVARVAKLFGCLAASLAVSACMTAPQVSVHNPGLNAAELAGLRQLLNDGTASQATTFSEEVSILRYISADASGWPRAANASDRLNPTIGFSDLYARFVLLPRGTEAGGGIAGQSLRDYAAEERDWFERIFAKQTDSVVAVANITVMNPNLKLTVPLYSITYASGGGVTNQWASSLTSSHARSPLFRIESGSRAAIQLNTHVSRDVKSRGVSVALRAVTTAVSVAAPETALLTKLSGEEVNARANALDGAISTLMSNDIVEDLEVGRMISTWQPDAHVLILGCAPFVRVEGKDSAGSGDSVCGERADLDGGMNHLVGQWELTLSCPQFSVFSDRSICQGTALLDVSTVAARKSVLTTIAGLVGDSQVLSYQLSSQVTVREFLRGRPWFTAFLAKSSPQSGDFASMCALAMNDLQEQGLTGFDSALGLRALFKLAPELVGRLSEIRTGAAALPCRDLMTEQGVSL